MSKTDGKNDLSPRVREIFKQMQAVMRPTPAPDTESSGLSPNVQRLFREMRDIAHTPVFRWRK